MKFKAIGNFCYDQTICLIIVLISLLTSYVTEVTDAFVWICAGFLIFSTVINFKFAKDYYSSNIIKFCKVKDDANIPSKRKEDAGYDVYACFDEEWIEIAPHETVMIPTGISSVFDRRYTMVLNERGSTGTKGMGQRSGVIDSGYRGEWLVPITNHNRGKSIVIIKKSALDAWREDISRSEYDEDQFILYPYEKAVCQALLLPVPNVDIREIENCEFNKYKSERGKRRLGSSGK